MKAGCGEERIEGKLEKNKDDGNWGMLWGWGGIRVGCVDVVLVLTQFCVQHVGNGVIRGFRIWDA